MRWGPRLIFRKTAQSDARKPKRRWSPDSKLPPQTCPQWLLWATAMPQSAHVSPFWRSVELFSGGRWRSHWGLCASGSSAYKSRGDKLTLWRGFHLNQSINWNLMWSNWNKYLILHSILLLVCTYWVESKIELNRVVYGNCHFCQFLHALPILKYRGAFPSRRGRGG